VSLFYVGGIGSDYKLHELFAAVKQAWEEKSLDVRLIVCLRPEDWDAVKHEYEQWACPAIEVVHGHGNVLQEYFERTNVATIVVDLDEYWKLGVPVKLYDYIGAGKPVMVTKGSLAGDMVERMKAFPTAAAMMLAVRPHASFHVINIRDNDTVSGFHRLEELPIRENGGDDEETLLREAHMRKALRTAKRAHEKIAVVCGAYHVPALTAKVKVADDNVLLKQLPKVKTQLTWVPWSHGRLAASSGYGAGVRSPGWYHHLFAAPDRPVERLEATRTLEDCGNPICSPPVTRCHVSPLSNLATNCSPGGSFREG